MQLFTSISISNIARKCFLPLFICLLTACVEKRDQVQNIVIAHFSSEPITLNPVNGSDQAHKYVQEYAQKTLTRIDMRTLEQIPILVKALGQVSENGLAFTYTLRDDVKWDDGSPLTVDDVIFTIKVSKNPLTANQTQKSTFDNIKDIKKDASDSLKFTVYVKEQYYKNPNLFDEVYIIQKKFHDPESIFSKVQIWELDDEKFDPKKYEGLEAWTAEFNKGENGHDPAKLNGLGAYKVTNWETGNSVTLERKKNWWGADDTSIYNKAHPDKIIFRFFSDDAAIYLALKKQNLDVVTFISTSSFLKLRESDEFNKNYYSGLTEQFSYNYLGMNMKPGGKNKSFFKDKKVRKAMAFLLPVDEVIETLVQGQGIRQASFVQKVNKQFYNDSLPIIKYDLEKGKQLLEEAGWKDTDNNGIRDKVINGKKVQFSFEYTYMANANAKEVALMYKEALYKAGIDLQPNPVDGGKLVSQITNRDFDMISAAWAGGAIPEDPEQIFHTRNFSNGGYNYVGFGNAETDKMMDEASMELDPKKRAVLLKKLQAVVYEESPYIFTFSTPRKIIIHKRFQSPGMFSERPGVMLNTLKLDPDFKVEKSAE